MPLDSGIAAARGVAVAVLVLILARPLVAMLRHAPPRTRALVWLGLLPPLLTPAVVVGYAYAGGVFAWSLDPVGKEVIYVLLLGSKHLPVGAIALLLVPSPLTPEARHCRALLAVRPGRAGRRRIAHGWKNLPGPPVLAGALVFLLVFGEFEMASLLGVRTWTVTLFEAHAGGLELGESLRLAAVPFVVESCLLVASLAGLFAVVRRTDRAAGSEACRSRGRGGLLAWCVLLSAFAIASGFPGVRLLSGLLSGFRLLLENFNLGKDILASLLFGGSAAALAWLAAAGVLKSTRRVPLSVIGAFALPGLVGPLVLGLAVLALFQLPGLSRLYDSPLPLTIAQTLILLPMALLLRIVVVPRIPDTGLKLAAMLSTGRTTRTRAWSSKIAWQVRGRRVALAVFLLLCWGYFDLTAASLLAPSSMTPVFVRLYNLMHYGESTVLSAMVAVVMLVPVLLLLASGCAWRLLSMRQVRHG